MRKKVFTNSVLAFLFLASAGLTSCLNDTEETIILEKPNTGIPDDSDASPNPKVTDVTTTIPNVQAIVDYIDGVPIIRLDMTGIKNSGDVEWMRLYGTGFSEQNVWLEVDGSPKGILVYNNADNNETESIPVDIVFTVDNSGSMGQEADAIARDIASWAESLVKAGLNARFGVVGYGYHVGAQFSYLVNNYGVAGALDLTSNENLYAYLNRPSFSGINRTVGYEGANKDKLAAVASNYSRAGGECGVQAIRFVDENFSFRPGANRVYINFTDDANYTGNDNSISIKYISNESTWPAAKGTIHSVISGSKDGIISSANSLGGAEIPWLISEYTGGTVLFASSTFTGVSLSDLPVTGAMENSYIIRFTNIEEFLDGKPHLVHITIVSKDGKVCADKVFTITFGTL